MYEWVVLSFGLSSAPRVFTKLLKPVYAELRSGGIRCSYYIDDSLQMDQDFDKALDNTNVMVINLTKLGYTVNTEKSVLFPTKRLVFFGLVVDSEELRVYLTDDKIEKLLDLLEICLSTSVISVRTLAKVI